MRCNLLFSSVLTLLALPMAATGAVVINEINYDPYGTDNASNAEWVELYNTDSTAVDLTGWTMTAGSFNAFSFPDDASIAGHGFVVIKYGETHAVRSYYKGGLDSATLYDFELTGSPGSKLSNGNATTIALIDQNSNTVQSVNYKNSASTTWPSNDGPRNVKSSGLTFELTNPLAADTNDGTNWAITRTPSGTPGRWNSQAGLWYENAGRNLAYPTPIDDVIISIDPQTSTTVASVEAFVAVGSSTTTYSPAVVTQSGATYSANLGNIADNTLVSYYFKITGAGGETVFYPFLAPGITEQFIVADAVPAATDIAINELGLNPSGSDNRAGSEFIELLNLSANPIDISGYIVGRYLNDPYWNIVPRGTVLQPNGQAGSFFVFAGRQELMPTMDPAVNVADFGWTQGLSVLPNSNSGGAFYARPNDMIWTEDWTEMTLTPVRSLAYTINDLGWPNTTDGYSWELIEPTADFSVGTNWSMSTDVGGTPGASNSVSSVNEWSLY